MNTTIPIYIGYDSSEISAYHVLSQSIHRHATMPVSITPIKLKQLERMYTRGRAENHSTEFSLSRFLTPWLNKYSDWAIFMDCDMLCRVDIKHLWLMRDDHYSVLCAKHDYTPKTDFKMLGSVQTKYNKKNWSSVMLLNCKRCFALTPEYVNKASGLELHQFKWLESDEQIGDLPLEWNWLVGEYDYNKNAKIVHYTLGGPWWSGYKVCDYADEWRDVFNETTQNCS